MSIASDLSALEAFGALPRAQRSLIFYSEGGEHWPHLGPIVRNIIDVIRHPVVYVSSKQSDPGLRVRSPLLKTFCISSGASLANFFKSLEADVMVMTMPDLESFYIKRSPRCRHYSYIFHSPVSTHMIYQPGAFDHYDSIFCVGPHHEGEIRRREEMRGDPPKQLFRHGYGRLDDLMAKVPAVVSGSGDEPTHVLVAPSWGPNGIFETVGVVLLKTLLDAGYRVTARPHPQTLKLAGDCIAEIRNTFSNNSNFCLETDMGAKESFYRSDVMVCDWSGAALDYAFGLLKPVIFIDMPRKVNNPDYQALGIDPLEVTIRSRIGKIFDPKDFSGLPAAITEMKRNAAAIVETIRGERSRWIYNLGDSAGVAAGELVRLATGFAFPGDNPPDDPDIAARRAAAELLRQSGSEDETPGAPGSVVALVARIVNGVGPIADGDLNSLHALCRKTDISKKLVERYDEAFAKAVDATPLAREALPALVWAFISAARQVAAADRGRALKYVNSAGNALDVYVAGGGVNGASLLEGAIFRAYDGMGLRA